VPLAEYFKIAAVGGRVSFSADEKEVAFLGDQGGRQQVWVKPLAGGAARELTHADGFIDALAFSPTHDTLAFETDHGGDELPHLYLQDGVSARTASEPRDIAPELPAGRRTAFVEWAEDGRTLLYQANPRDEKALDLYEYDLGTKRSKLLWRSDGGSELVAVSHDHRRFVTSERHSDVDDDLYIVDRASPSKRELATPHQGAAHFTAQYLSRDDRFLYATTDGTGEQAALVAIDLGTKSRAPVRAGDWDVDVAALSSTGRYALTSANRDGSPDLVVTATAGNTPIALPAPPPGGVWDASDETNWGSSVLGFSPRDRYLAVIWRGDVGPPTPYALDLESGRAIALADPVPPRLRDLAMVSGQSVRIPSFDGRMVPAFLYRPAGTGPFPAVIDVHGGPTSQSPRSFSRMRQYLVSKGYAVLVPNVRGSTGYGKTWARLDDLDLGGGPLQDVVACKRWLVANASVAADQVAVMGASYGGYMALAAATFTPDEFAANVDFFGISDIKSLVEGFPSYWAMAAAQIHKKWGDPADPKDAAYQHDRSPIHFTSRVTRPLLVVQGENDMRVKKPQSEAMVSALRQRHVPVTYLLLPNEGHGFSKTANTVAADELADRFLDRYVRGDASVVVE
jgi:dipeptidyl aminopeptidase/acylaminoacyl peptidase